MARPSTAALNCVSDAALSPTELKAALQRAEKAALGIVAIVAHLRTAGSYYLTENLHPNFGDSMKLLRKQLVSLARLRDTLGWN